MSRGWHLLRASDGVTLTRRVPVRMDVVAETVLPDMRLLPLVHHVRQDLWRALQRVRGFSPVVRARRSERGVALEAGGRIDGAVPPGVSARIAELLEDPARRARWARWSA
ncbi:hypothetical protein [Pseudaestuariivita sp.]|uniref:hypothetical protein n=1 Tax=Pseudaestuariivita sp. TaxID=2211669 RepID=UPI004059EC74